MRTMRLSLAGPLCLVVAAVLPASVLAQGDDPADTTSDPPGEVMVINDLVYATGGWPDAPTELRLDAYVGGEGDDAPLVVYVPGYLEVARGQTHLAQTLAEQGTTVLVVDGPNLRPETAISENAQGYRALAEAVACAVRFARGSAYGSETAPLVLVGFSFGAGVASHVALAGTDFDRVWDEHEASGGGPPAQYGCTASEASTRVDDFVGIGGPYDTFVGIEGLYGRDFLVEHDQPDLWQTLWATVGLHPELRVRLLHSDPDYTVPFEQSALFEALLVEAGYDVALTAFEGGHTVPQDLLTETVMGLVG